MKKKVLDQWSQWVLLFGLYKLGQFLATRPDIIGEKLSDQLQSLQDKVPRFQLENC